MTRTLCDLCGKEIRTYDKTKWKLKYFWSDQNGSGWIPIDAHEECLKAVAFVVCDNCGASSTKSKDAWRCVEAWNRREKE